MYTGGFLGGFMFSSGGIFRTSVVNMALVLRNPMTKSGLPDWAISRGLGYPKVLLATDFYSGRFANFWATRNFDERILGEQILSSFVSLFV